MGSLEQFFKIEKGKTLDTNAHSSNHICIQFIVGIIYFKLPVSVRLSLEIQSNYMSWFWITKPFHEKVLRFSKTHLAEPTLSRGKNEISNNVLLTIFVDNINVVEIRNK